MTGRARRLRNKLAGYELNSDLVLVDLLTGVPDDVVDRFLTAYIGDLSDDEQHEVLNRIAQASMRIEAERRQDPRSHSQPFETTRH